MSAPSPESRAACLAGQSLGWEGGKIVPVSLHAFDGLDGKTPYQLRSLEVEVLALHFLMGIEPGTVSDVARRNNILPATLMQARKRICEKLGWLWAISDGATPTKQSLAAKARWQKKRAKPAPVETAA